MGGAIAAMMCECAFCLGCSCFGGIVNFTLSQASRFGHMLVLIVPFVLAVSLGLHSPDAFDDNTEYSGLHLADGCTDEYKNNCIYRQMVYRASFANFILFTGS